MEKKEYSHTTFTKKEMELVLLPVVGFIEFQRICAAYDMAESVHEYQFRNDGSPYFYHCTRTARIIVELAGINDPDVLCAALLHDVLEDSPALSKEVLEYNFGAYTAYLVELLTKDLTAQELSPDDVDTNHAELLGRSPEDALIIKLSARLDNFRCLQFNLKRNPLRYIQTTTERYLPLAEEAQHPCIPILLHELKNERNKFLG